MIVMTAARRMFEPSYTPSASQVEIAAIFAQRTTLPMVKNPQSHGTALAGEHLIVTPGTLVFYIDDSGDETFGDIENPIQAHSIRPRVSQALSIHANQMRLFYPRSEQELLILPQLSAERAAAGRFVSARALQARSTHAQLS